MTTSMYRSLKWRAALACALLPLAALGAGLTIPPEKAIKARQSGYFLMGQQMARINATVKGDLPYDKPSLQMSAELLELLSRMVIENYPAGSDQGATKAKPEIWKDTTHFNQLAAAMTAEAGKLKAAVNSGDLALIKAAYGKTSQSCKACHDDFKAR